MAGMSRGAFCVFCGRDVAHLGCGACGARDARRCTCPTPCAYACPPARPNASEGGPFDLTEPGQLLQLRHEEP